MCFFNTYKKQLSSSLSADDSVAEELLLLSEWSVPVMSMSLWKRCSRFTINIFLKVLLYLANRGFHAKKIKKERKKPKGNTKLKYLKE